AYRGKHRRCMLRVMLPTRRCGIAVPLSLVFFASTAAAPGCNKIKEATGKTEDAPAAASDEAKTDEAKTDEKKAEDPKPVADKAPEPIPVEPMLSGLDLMLSFVPDEKASYMIVRDASVFGEYAEEAGRFIEAPLKALGSDPAAVPAELADAQKQIDEVKAKSA